VSRDLIVVRSRLNLPLYRVLHLSHRQVTHATAAASSQRPAAAAAVYQNYINLPVRRRPLKGERSPLSPHDQRVTQRQPDGRVHACTNRATARRVTDCCSGCVAPRTYTAVALHRWSIRWRHCGEVALARLQRDDWLQVLCQVVLRCMVCHVFFVRPSNRAAYLSACRYGDVSTAKLYRQKKKDHCYSATQSLIICQLVEWMIVCARSPSMQLTLFLWVWVIDRLPQLRSNTVSCNFSLARYSICSIQSLTPHQLPLNRKCWLTVLLRLTLRWVAVWRTVGV